MKKLLNVLYVTSPDYYLKKEGRNIVISLEGKRVARYPIHILRQVVCFNYMGVSPDLMKMCMEENVSISFFTFLLSLGRHSSLIEHNLQFL